MAPGAVRPVPDSADREPTAPIGPGPVTVAAMGQVIPLHQPVASPGQRTSRRPPQRPDTGSRRDAEPVASPEPLWREAIGAELRDRRRSLGLRLVDAAGVAGVTPQYLSEVERGRKDPSSELLAAMSGALGLSVVDLAGRAIGRPRARPQGPVCLAA